MLGALQALYSTRMTAAIRHKDVQDGNCVATVVQPPLAGQGRGAQCFALVGCTLALAQPLGRSRREKLVVRGLFIRQTLADFF